ncbi:sugar transferase [Halomonas sp. EGI 63088]|uniref:Sugar transferase n=1 Tax=Halomonas flagellata TaxID=2920385 RepID=A0ABS9S0B6_9GAMM|nr:sugar transferase [Halomonas flagellata]MCH4565532.1 sugar transferase [Halomonas flagellata]
MSAKRGLDLLEAGVLLLLLSPSLLTLALMIRWRLGFPVWFRQMCPDLNRRPFELVKYCSMLNDYDANRELLPSHLRLTSFGRWLRATRLDELHELWNVLRGI